MLRDKNLIPLSHQHQRALALCVRIDRAQPIPESDLPAWQSEIAQLYRQEIETHFSVEEEILFPVARQHHELAALAEELTADHFILREFFSRAEAQQLSADSVMEFEQRLSAHVRTEERQLFERMQQLLSADTMAALGSSMQAALVPIEQLCAVPNAITRLRTKR